MRATPGLLAIFVGVAEFAEEPCDLVKCEDGSEGCNGLLDCLRNHVAAYWRITGRATVLGTPRVDVLINIARSQGF